MCASASFFPARVARKKSSSSSSPYTHTTMLTLVTCGNDYAPLVNFLNCVAKAKYGSPNAPMNSDEVCFVERYAKFLGSITTVMTVKTDGSPHETSSGTASPLLEIADEVKTMCVDANIALSIHVDDYDDDHDVTTMNTTEGGRGEQGGGFVLRARFNPNLARDVSHVHIYHDECRRHSPWQYKLLHYGIIMSNCHH